MADVTTSVTAVVSVVDKATPAIAQITQSLKGVEQVQDQINKAAADIPRSYADIAAQAASRNIWNLPVRGEDVVPDLTPAVAAQVEKIGSVWDQLKDRMSSIGAAIKEKLGAAFETVAGIAGRVAGKIGSFFSSIGGLTAGGGAFAAGYGIAAVIESMFKGVDELVQTVDKLGPVAKNLGITIGEFQRLALWGKESGVGVSQMSTALQNLTKTIGGVDQGLKGFGKAAEAFDKLGISLRDPQGNLKNVTQILPELATALQAIGDPAERAAVASGALGTSWKVLLPLLMQGPEAIDAATAMSQKLGEIGPDTEAAAGAYKKAAEDWAAAMVSLRSALGEKLLPLLTPVLEKLTDFVATNREAIATGIGAVVDGLIVGFQTLAPIVSGTVSAFQAVGNALNAIVEAQDKFAGFMRENVWGKLGEFLSTPLPDIWGNLATNIANAWSLIEPILAKFWEILQDIAKWTGLGGLVTGFEAIAGSISKAADAWQRWQGTPAAPAPAPAPAGGPVAVSPGGGPLTWENLGQPPPLLGPMPQAANGQVNVVIENKNPPPGTRTTAKASGPGVTADVGQSMPWTAPTYSGPWAPAGAT